MGATSIVYPSLSSTILTAGTLLNEPFSKSKILFLAAIIAFIESIKSTLKYVNNQPAILGLERVSKPGLRIYVGKREIPRVYGGLGIAILSTSKGLMVGHEAYRQNLGGELLCYIW